MANALQVMRKENNLEEKKLSKENNSILTDMVIYLKSYSLIEYDVEVMRKELIGMALEAQLRNEKLSEVIGDDYKKICNELMENARKQTKGGFILQSISTVVLCATILYIFEIFLGKTIVKIVTKGEFVMPITLGFAIYTVLTIIFAVTIYMYITRKSFELSGEKSLKYKVLFVIIFIALWFTIFICKYMFDKTILFSVNCLYPLAFLIATCIGFNIFESKNINKLANSSKA